MVIGSESEDITERAKMFAMRSVAENTRRAYQADLRHFSAYCTSAKQQALPAAPETLVSYLATAAGQLRVSTLERRIAAIAVAHKAAGFASPTADIGVRTVLAGIRRTYGVAARGKKPITVAQLRCMSETLDETPIGMRDRALLLVGFAGGFRRSELVSLDIADVEFSDEGAIVNLRRSKTDPEGQGRKIGLPYGGVRATCPVRSLRRWLNLLGAAGPVFRPVNRYGTISSRRLSARGVALVVKRCAGRLGLNLSDFAGHSLRAGLVTAAAKAGLSEAAIARQSGHRSLAVMRRYVRDASLFTGNAAASIGL